MSLRVLNEEVPANGNNALSSSKKLDAKESLELSRVMQKLIKRVKGEFAMGEFIDYCSLRSSELFNEFQTAASQLSLIDLDSFNDSQSKAFFINVYNTLTLHGVLSVDPLPDSVLKVKKFWNTTCYRIGEHVYSLDDIEHGILRANNSHPSSKKACFEEDDPRLKYAAKKVDPRIHFALNCGAKSCPAISAYSEENLEQALENAATNFCRQEIIVLPKNEEVYLSRLFEWYERDFGANDVAAVQWTLPYLEDEKRDQLSALLNNILSVGSGKILYNEYDWSLNSAFR